MRFRRRGVGPVSPTVISPPRCVCVRVCNLPSRQEPGRGWLERLLNLHSARYSEWGPHPGCLLRAHVGGVPWQSPPRCPASREPLSDPTAGGGGNGSSRKAVCLSLPPGIYLGPCGPVAMGPGDLSRNLLVLLRRTVRGTASSLSSELEPREGAERPPSSPSSQRGWPPWHSGLPDDLRLWLKEADAMHSAAVRSQAQSSSAHRLRPTP